MRVPDVRFAGIVGTIAAVAGLGGALAAGSACNAVLGISAASVEDGGTDAGTPCEAYCTAVVKSCPNAEYNDVPTCLALCGALDLGQPTDTNKDSVGCRAHYAALSASDPSNCRAAGPLGGGVCGSSVCANFCQLDTYACTGDNAQFDGGEVGCEAECAALFPTYLIDAGNDLALSDGNTLNCRIWHLQAAVAPGGGAAMLAEHCPHTGIPSQSAFCHD
jgi:hypothetical protein